MSTVEDLENTLRRIDGRGYRAYRDVHGSWDFSNYTLYVDHVQGDPFAAPSRIRARISADTARFPSQLFSNPVRKMALADWLARSVRSAISSSGASRVGSGRGGLIAIDAGGQEVLERSAILVTPDWIEARLSIGLPAAGRSVLGRQAMEMLCQQLPELLERSLFWDLLPQQTIEQFVNTIENQESIRTQLRKLGLIAFVGNGSMLPRESGASDLPLQTGKAVPFLSPAKFSVTVEVPHSMHPEDSSQNTISGMGVPEGVTLIVGGGYHGKSTLLRALERGVHPHIPGDGREWVVSKTDLVKIRAEDGRSVSGVDISGFIGSLPGESGGIDAQSFSTTEASGSTSQAANITEALEAGCCGLLLDEDTSATNFMVRDARMQALIASEDEPITPFLDRVRELFESQGVSTVIVMGGCGDYFDVADHVLAMREYQASDVSDDARRIAADQPSLRRQEPRAPLRVTTPRVPDPSSFDASRGKRDVKIDARGCDQIVYGRTEINIRALEQLLDPSQTRAIGKAIYWATQHLMDGRRTIQEILDALDSLLDEEGFEALSGRGQNGQHPGQLARPRRYEISGALNRMRSLKLIR